MLSTVGKLSRDLRCDDMVDKLEEDDDEELPLDDELELLLWLLLLLLRIVNDDVDEDGRDAAEQNF
jgi:hypothetical protein